eukprot:TRINITY_DN9348_c0_g3_i2.p1 TRINITY_DN9348_c0_g3~~TRINITY_DN9348_c0_g3_i2.p1  ORF type:complete len:358 (-),score=120.09 TRINITY_DN9348_c0_g3_i2:137-1210(-)
MKGWHWALLGVGAVSIGGLAYYALKNAGGEYDKSKVDVAEVMQQCLIESMETYLRTYRLGVEIKTSQNTDKAKFRQALTEKAGDSLQKIEEIVCRRNGWEMDKYYREILKRKDKGDRKIIDLFKKIDTFLPNSANGVMPRIRFAFPRELTEEVTLKLFKWVMLSDSYEAFKNAELLASSAPEAEKKQVIEERSKESSRKKDLLLRRFNVSIYPNENYKLTIQRAYFTYFTNDQEFERKAKELQSLNKVLINLLASYKKVPEFNKDPFEMEEDELERLYIRLCSLYLYPQSLNEEEKKQKKTLSKAEEVDSIQIDKSNESELPESEEVKEQEEKPEDTKKAEDNPLVAKVPGKEDDAE